MRRSVIVFALLLAACDPQEPSDAGQYRLEVSLERPLGHASRQVLVGSEFDVGVNLSSADGEPLATSCIEQTGTGVVVPGDAFSLRVDGVGPGAVELAVPADGCPDDPVFDALAPDRWSLTGVAASEVSGRWAYDIDASILAYGMSPGSAGAFPDAIGRPLGELPVVADQLFAVKPALVRTDAPEQEVRWADQGRRLLVPEHYDHLRPLSEYTPDGHVQRIDGAIGAGESFDAALQVLGDELALPHVRAIDVDEVVSLELVPVYWPDDGEQREWGPPAGVLALAHDADGRRVLGAPVEFSIVRGALAIDPDRDLLYTDDICRGDPGKPVLRAATVVGQVGEVVAEVDLDWIAVPGDAAAWFEDDSKCAGQTCACSSAGGQGTSVLGLLALLGLGGWLRRRPRQRELGTVACGG